MKRFVSIVVSVALCLIVGILGILGKYKIPIVPIVPINTQNTQAPHFLTSHCYLLFCIIMMLL